MGKQRSSPQEINHSEPDGLPIDDLRKMASIGLAMLDRALRSLIQRDADQARRIPQEDDQVDNINSRFFHELLQRLSDRDRLRSNCSSQIYPNGSI